MAVSQNSNLKRSIRVMTHFLNFRIFLLLFAFSLLFLYCFFPAMYDLRLIALREIPLDHPFRPILEEDNKTNFLAPDVREFLLKSANLAFPTRYNAVFLRTLLEFDRVWRRQLNRSYMLYAGTLVGAFRHGHRTPWDDALDVMVDLKYNAAISRDLDNSAFSVTAASRQLYLTNGSTQQAPDARVHWPGIHLFFFTKNGTEVVVSGSPNAAFPAELAFPASELAYMGHKFPAPRCPEPVLKATVDKFDLITCRKASYSHRLDLGTRSSAVNCSRLHGLFQFAKYQRINATHTRQFLSKALPPRQLPAMRREGEVWTKGAVLRTALC